MKLKHIEWRNIGPYGNKLQRLEFGNNGGLIMVLGKNGHGKSFTVGIPKMIKKLAEYRPLRDKYMKEHPNCEVVGCNSLSQDLHHSARRGKNLCNVDTFIAVCRGCHIYIEDNPIESKKLGYLK